MQLRLGANTQQEIDDAKGMLVYFNCPKDTPEIRENLRGLILCLARARFYQDNPLKDVRFGYTAKALDGIEVHFMSDELLNRGVNSLIEIEFTLKQALTLLGKDKSVKFFIDKPGEPAIDSNTGEWDLTDNKQITVNRNGVFEVQNTLTSSNVTEVLSIGLLEDVTGLLPDLNPFNLESKLTYIYNAFYAGLDINPLVDETFYSLVRRSLNNTGLLSDKSWFDYLNTNLVSSFNENNTDGVASNSYFRYLHTWLTVDWPLFQTVSEAIRDCICLAKDYINGLIQPLTDVSTAINGLELSPVINNNIDNCCSDLVDATKGVADKIKELTDETKSGNDTLKDADGKTLSDKVKELTDEIKRGNDNQISGDDQKQLLKDISDSLTDIANATKNDGNPETTTVTDNGDGTYTVETPAKELTSPKEHVPTTSQGSSNNNNTVNDPKMPNFNTNPYKAKRLLSSECQDSECGYVYKYMMDTADGIDEILSYAEPIADMLIAMGFTAADIVSWGVNVASVVSLIISGGTDAPLVAGVSLVKAGGVKVVKDVGEVAVKAIVVHTGAAVGRAIANSIRTRANDVACSGNVKATKVDFMQYLKLAVIADTAFNPIVYQIGSLIWDYKNASDTDVITDNMNDYAQYCPCAVGCECLAPYITVENTSFSNPDASVVAEPKTPLSGTSYHQYTIVIQCDTQLKKCIKSVQIDWNGANPAKDPVPTWNSTGWIYGGNTPTNVSPSDVNGYRITVESFSVLPGSVILRIGSIRKSGQHGNYLRVTSIMLGDTVN